jgi:phage tail-like protein
MSMAISANFVIEIDGVAIPTVAEVSAPELEIDVVEHKDVNNKGLYVIHRVPGKYKAGSISVTRQLKAGELGFEQWLLATWKGNPVGKTIGLTYKDSAGKTVREVNFNFGMVKSVEISNLKAGDTSAVTEKVTIEHTGLSLPGVDLIL